MDENPYESPKIPDSSSGRAANVPRHPLVQFRQIVGSVAWAAFLFFSLPAVQHIPLWLRVATTVITLWAIYDLFRAARSWGHILCAPIHFALITLQKLIWAFPN